MLKQWAPRKFYAVAVYGLRANNFTPLLWEHVAIKAHFMPAISGDGAEREKTATVAAANEK